MRGYLHEIKMINREFKSDQFEIGICKIVLSVTRPEFTEGPSFMLKIKSSIIEFVLLRYRFQLVLNENFVKKQGEFQQ